MGGIIIYDKMKLMTNVVLSSIPFYANPNILGIQIPSNGLMTIPNLAIESN